MIEAQEATTEGAHVAVPEGLVPATKMITVIADVHSPPAYECFLHGNTSRTPPHPGSF